MGKVHDAFQVHMLNANGINEAKGLADAFSTLLYYVEEHTPKGREQELVITKLQEASFFAKRAIAMNPENNET